MFHGLLFFFKSYQFAQETYTYIEGGELMCILGNRDKKRK